MGSSASIPKPTYAKPGSLRSNPGGKELLQIISFRLGEEEFGLDILRVQEIIRLPQLTRVPKSAEFVEGVINLRGNIIPVISLRKRFGLPEIVPDSQARIIVVEAGETVLGFAVDSVSQVLTIPPESIEPPPRLGKVECEYVSGVGKVGARLLILLHADRLMQTTKDSLTSRNEPSTSAAITGRLS